MRVSLRTAAWAAFFVLSALFLSVIGYGISTADFGYKHLFLLERNERVLAPDQADPDLGLELRVVDLREKPALEVRVAGLQSKVPLRVWLTGAEPGAGAMPLTHPVHVDPQGRTNTRLMLPEQSLRHYRFVVGVQGRRVIFRAPLS